MRRPRRLSGGWITAQAWMRWTARVLTLQLQRVLHCKQAARLRKAALSIQRQCVRTRTIVRVCGNVLLQQKHLPWILQLSAAHQQVEHPDIDERVAEQAATAQQAASPPAMEQRVRAQPAAPHRFVQNALQILAQFQSGASALHEPISMTQPAAARKAPWQPAVRAPAAGHPAAARHAAPQAAGKRAANAQSAADEHAAWPTSGSAHRCTAASCRAACGSTRTASRRQRQRSWRQRRQPAEAQFAALQPAVEQPAVARANAAQPAAAPLRTATQSAAAGRSGSGGASSNEAFAAVLRGSGRRCSTFGTSKGLSLSAGTWFDEDRRL